MAQTEEVSNWEVEGRLEVAGQRAGQEDHKGFLFGRGLGFIGKVFI
jgi:hypothetical protein